MEGFSDKQKNVYKLELRGTENFKRGILDTSGAVCEATLKSWNQTLLKNRNKIQSKNQEKKGEKTLFCLSSYDDSTRGKTVNKLVLLFPATITRGPN